MKSAILLHMTIDTRFIDMGLGPMAKLERQKELEAAFFGEARPIGGSYMPAPEYDLSLSMIEHANDIWLDNQQSADWRHNIDLGGEG